MPVAPEYAGNTLSFNIDNVQPERVASILNEKNICVRSGFHCAALGHNALGTQPLGTVRVSFGLYNTVNDIDNLVLEINKIAK